MTCGGWVRHCRRLPRLCGAVHSPVAAHRLPVAGVANRPRPRDCECLVALAGLAHLGGAADACQVAARSATHIYTEAVGALAVAHRILGNSQRAPPGIGGDYVRSRPARYARVFARPALPGVFLADGRVISGRALLFGGDDGRRQWLRVMGV